MSWAEMKSAVNSTVGTGNFSPLDRLVKEALDKYFYDNLVMCSMVFSGDGTEKYIVVPPDTQEIEDYQYRNKKYVMAILPPSVTKIGEAAFSGTPIRMINLPNNVSSIGRAAFSNCDLRYGINIPEGIKTISSETFMNTNIRNIVFPDSLEEIDSWALVKCTSLKTVRLGKNIKSIDRRAVREPDIDMDAPTEINDVYYAGTEEEWNRVAGNNAFWGATIHYNS